MINQKLLYILLHTFLLSFLTHEINAEQQEQLKGIYEKFKEEVDQHLEKCRRTLEGLETHQVQVKGMVEKQSKISFQLYIICR